MANNNGIITEPGIGLEPDIYGTLGVGRYNGLFDTGYICCNQHGKTNPCAKFKPTRAGTGPDTPADWWRGADGMCGFNIPRYDTLGNLDMGFIHDLISGAAAWTYLAPRPGVDFCRFTDFNGYNHYAGELFGSIEAGTYITSNGAGDLAITVVPPLHQAQGQLLPSDITVQGTSLSQFYLGVVLWKDDRFIIRTSTTPGAFTSFTVKNTGITGIETWNAMLFLSSVVLDSGLEGKIGDYIAAKRTDAAQLKIIGINSVHVVRVSFLGWVGTQYRQCKATVTCVNNHPTEAFTFENIRADLLKGSTGASGSAGYGLGIPSSMEVAPNSSVDASVTLNTVIAQTGGTQYFQLTASASAIVSENNVPITINY